MTDPSSSAAPSSSESLVELVELVTAEAGAIAALDAARAEAWASDVLALGAEWGIEPASLVDALLADGGNGATTTLAALAGLVEVPALGSDQGPEWTDLVGTSTCEGAWALRVGGAESVAFRFVDRADERHVITVDLVAGPPETVGEVIVGPGDLLDALREDDADIESEDAGPGALADRCMTALGATDRPTATAVANGRLLIRRMASLTEVQAAPPIAVAEEVPEPPARDPEDDAYALDVLRRALGTDPAPDDDAVAIVAQLVAPTDMEPLTPAQRDAALILEWADWLGAVIGLVRAGEGCLVDGAVMVDMVNRCPEVDSTIPKSDRARIEWAFDIMTEPWPALGLIIDGRLSDLGLRVLPAALRRAWGDAHPSSAS